MLPRPASRACSKNKLHPQTGTANEAAACIIVMQRCIEFRQTIF